MNGTQKIAQFAEKLDVDEAKDLLLCCLYLLNAMPKQSIMALAFIDEFVEQSDTFPMIALIKLAIRLFRCKEKNSVRFDYKIKKKILETTTNADQKNFVNCTRCKDSKCG